MPSRKYKTWQLLIILLLSIIIPMATIAFASQGVSKNVACKPNHPTRKDFRENVRVIFPVTILEIVGNRVNYAINDEGIELGSLDLEEGYSIVPKNFNSDGCYFIDYCQKHLVILQISELPKAMCRTVKN